MTLQDWLQVGQFFLLLVGASTGSTSLFLILAERRNKDSQTKKNHAEAHKVDTETRLAKEEYYQRVASELFEKYEGLKKLHDELKGLYDSLKLESKKLQEESIRLRAAIEYVFVEIKDVFPQVVERARKIISSE